MEEKVIRNGRTIALGQAFAAPMVAAPSPWAVAIVTSVVGAAAGWMIEEVARRRRRR